MCSVSNVSGVNTDIITNLKLPREAMNRVEQRCTVGHEQIAFLPTDAIGTNNLNSINNSKML